MGLHSGSNRYGKCLLFAVCFWFVFFSFLNVCYAKSNSSTNIFCMSCLKPRKVHKAMSFLAIHVFHWTLEHAPCEYFWSLPAHVSPLQQYYCCNNANKRIKNNMIRILKVTSWKTLQLHLGRSNNFVNASLSRIELLIKCSSERLCFTWDIDKNSACRHVHDLLASPTELSIRSLMKDFLRGSMHDGCMQREWYLHGLFSLCIIESLPFV